jgi:hypothetical protein
MRAVRAAVVSIGSALEDGRGGTTWDKKMAGQVGLGTGLII